MYELKAETEQECNNWVQAIDAARYVSALLSSFLVPPSLFLALARSRERASERGARFFTALADASSVLDATQHLSHFVAVCSEAGPFILPLSCRVLYVQRLRSPSSVRVACARACLQMA